MPLQSIQFYLGMILIRFQFLINVDSISIISWELLSISITISITETGPYQYQYIINFSKFSLSISMSISILHFFLINISLSMHCATLLRGLKRDTGLSFGTFQAGCMWVKIPNERPVSLYKHPRVP